MTEKNEPTLAGGFSVKAAITKQTFETLQFLEKKVGMQRSNAVRAALDEYLKKNYPEFYQKSDDELKMLATEKVKLRRYEQEYVDKTNAEESLPIVEISEQEAAKKMNKISEEMKVVVNKITNHSYKNKKELNKLESKLYRLNDELFNAKNVLISEHFTLLNLKSKKTF